MTAASEPQRDRTGIAALDAGRAFKRRIEAGCRLAARCIVRDDHFVVVRRQQRGGIGTTTRFGATVTRPLSTGRQTLRNEAQNGLHLLVEGHTGKPHRGVSARLREVVCQHLQRIEEPRGRSISP
jgi:hypothetical protein